MLLDARQFPVGTVLDAEICIVGAGAAGIAMAMALRGRGLRVLLLESGGLELEEATQALYEGSSVGVPNEALDVSRLRYFGGTTNHWAGWCRPLEPWDFRPGEVGAAGAADIRTWPITREVLDPYYVRAQAMCEMGPMGYDAPPPEGLAALALDPARLRTALFQVGPPARFGMAYRAALEQAADVRVVLHANVLEVAANGEASAVTGVRARSLEGPEFTATAKHYVLACGGIENARILLLSNRVQAAGLGNGHDVVGRYFMDHPWFFDFGFLAFTRPGTELPLYLDQTEALGGTVFGALAPDGAARAGGGFRVVMRPSYRVVEGVAALKAIGGEVSAGRYPRQFWDRLRAVFADADAVVDSAYKTAFGGKGLLGVAGPGERGPVLGANLDVNVEQMPNPASRVTLSSRRDALGQNRVALDWRPGDAEKATVRRAMELVGLEMGRLGLGRVRARTLADGPGWPGDMQGSRHHMGTTRMADDPRVGVVDAQCRVHGIANLHIAGSSVFASSGFANPTLTIVALALRLADGLARKFG